MGQMLHITAPIYLLILVGYIAVRSRFFSYDDMTVLGRLVVLICLPVLVFRALIQSDLEKVFDLNYLLVYGIASLSMLTLGLLAARRWLGFNLSRSALFGMAMGTSNSAFMGYPIVVQIVGPVAGVAMALGMVIENLFMIPIALALADSQPGMSRWQLLSHTLRSLSKHPIVWGLAAGFACSLGHVQLPGVLDRTTQLLANLAGPLALFMIGGVLVGQNVMSRERGLATLVLGKLVLHPLAVLFLLQVMHVQSETFAMAAVLYACMPLPASFPALAQRYGFDSFGARALVFATSLSFVTLLTWLWVLPQVFPAAVLVNGK